MTVGTDESLTLINGSLIHADGLELRPTSSISFQNTQLSKQVNTVNSQTISSTSLVFVFSNITPAYSGSIQVNYTTSELGSLTADSLSISVFTASQWNKVNNSTVNVVSRQVSAVLSSLPLKEITLQQSSTIVSLTTSISLSSSSVSSSSGSGSGSTPSSSVSTATSTSSSTNESDEATDADNDGYSSAIEIICGTDPDDPNSVPLDSDNDGEPNCIDEDDDNDTYTDILEIECGFNPLDSADFPSDFDGDTLVDCIDEDDDNDGYLDIEDAFPYNAFEWNDTDEDGIGNNADTDDDNDCFSDNIELDENTNPLDTLDYPLDQDQDCIPDSQDPDKNNNGYPDTELVLPEIFSPNGDGINDRLEILNLEYFPQNIVYIFSRSGFELVRIRNYNNSWSGMYKGQNVPEGSYLLVVDKEGDGTIDYNQWIYLTR